MASPQKENGYTPIAHEILEAVARYPLNGTQIKILLVIWRYTFGFNRKEHQLSESFIAKATGTSKRYISSELNRLIDLKIIRLIFPATYTKPKTIAFNKNYEQWAHSGTIVQQVKNTSTVEQNFNTPVEELFHPTVEEKGTL
jgi:phage replication O-like protein O